MMETETPEIGPYFSKVGPEIGPNADQLTALTRGRGPRRGNLEDLLKYWRPIMKKPGGFRRCVVILMDKPQFGGKPQRICAWLHHELTGKWPNEGKGKRGAGKGNRKRRGKLTRRVRSAARKAKSVDLSQPEYSGSSLRYAVSESRAYGGILVQPIAGRQNVVDMKAAIFRQYLDTPIAVEHDEFSVKRVGLFGSNSRFGQVAQAVGSSALPGNVSVVRSPVRSGIYRALTPGGGSGRGRRLAGAGRRLLGRSGRGARNRFRCPPGFENGGTFTDRRFSTCGAQVLGIPGVGPGSLIGGTGRALARLARNAELISSIGDLRSQRNPGVFIRAAQIPTTPKKVNVTARAAGVNTVLNAIDDDRWSIRVSKRDGVILEPVAGLSFFANQTGDFDDVVDGSLIIKNPDASFDSPEIVEAVQSINAGFRDVYFAIPEVGVVRFGREGGELSPADRASLSRTLPTRISRDADLPDPTAGLRGFADDSGGKFVVEFGNLNEQGRFNVEQADNKLVKVQGPGGTVRQVPQWVYETFLSRSAPRRAKDDPIFELVPEGKSVNPFFITAKAVQPDTLYKEYQADIAFKIDAYKDQAYLGGVNFKRVRPGGVPLRRALGGFASALAFFDPSISRYRCPPGFTGGGQLTNMRGTTCGRSLRSSTMLSLGNLQDARGKFARNRPGSGRLAGVIVDDIEEGSFRQGVFETQAAFDEVIADFDKLSERLPPVDQLDRLTPVNMPPLTDDVRAALDNIGNDLSAALRRVQFSGADELDEPSWEALASRLQDIATVEAQRQAYLDFYGIRSPGLESAARLDSDIDEFAGRLVGIAENRRVATTVDEVAEEGVTALSVGERAEERIEALIDLNDQDGLWDVASMVDYADLLDQLPMPETDEEDRRLGLTQEQFRDAMVNQVSKYVAKVGEDPDSLSLEEYSYLSYALGRIAETEGYGPDRRMLSMAYDTIYNLTADRRRRELGQLDRPSSERSEEALIYLILSTSENEYLDNVEDYAARMVDRVYAQLNASEGDAYDLFTKNVVMEKELERMLGRSVKDIHNVSMYESVADAMINDMFRRADAAGLTYSAEDKAVTERVLKDTISHMKRGFELQRVSSNMSRAGEDLDRLYSQFLDNDRDIERLVRSISDREFVVAMASLQMSIDNLYGVDGAEQNLAALIAFKTEFRDARAKTIGDVAGKINYVVNDPDLLPGPNDVPVWQVAIRERKKASTQGILTLGLSGLTPEEYDVSLPGETPYDTLYRLQSEGKLGEWALKLLNASDPKDAKDRSKRTIVAAYDARTDDDRPVMVEIDNVSNADSVYISTFDELGLVSDLYVTVFDEDGNELTRQKVSPTGNVVRTLAFSSDGSYSVQHDYVVVNSRDDPEFPFSVPLPDGSILKLDNRKRGISDLLNARYLGMAFAAGFKENHNLDVGWDGKYVWPKKGVRSNTEYKIKNLNLAFRDLVKNYDGAKDAIDKGQSLSRYQITALLVFDGDDSKRDRVASLLNQNLQLGDDKFKDWAQYPEFVQALRAKTGSKHEGHVVKLFKDSYLSFNNAEALALMDEVNDFIPAGSVSRITSVDEINALGSYADRSNQKLGDFTIDEGVIDLSSADINEIGC